MVKIAYQYNSEFIYTGTILVQEDPKNKNIFLLPPNSTFSQPPDFDSSSYIAVFSLINFSWAIQKNYVGTILYNTKNPSETITIQNPLQKPSDFPDYTINQPLPNTIWNGIEWIIDFNLLKNNTILQLQNQTISYILSFYSTVKQNSDLFDLQYFSNEFLVYQNNINSNELHLFIKTNTENIYNGYETLSNLISQYPDNLSEIIKQIFNSSIRIYWLENVKSIFNVYLNELQNTTTIDEINNINLNQINYPPFPVINDISTISFETSATGIISGS